MIKDMYHLDLVDGMLVTLGETILMRYEHPACWRDGITPETKHHKVLDVWEIRTFDANDPRAVQADVCALAIQAWIQSRQPVATRYFRLHRPNGPSGYITVSTADWGMALFYLRPLDRMRRELDAVVLGAARRG